MMIEEECFNPSKRRKIEETVLEILRTSDLEIATEFDVRAAAAERLGVDLSDFPHRRLVRQLVDSFLLSTATSIICEASSHGSDGDNNAKNNSNSVKNAVHPSPEQQQQQLTTDGVESQDKYCGKIICKLSDCRRVTVHESHGQTMVSIRDFYIKDGNMLPSKGLNSGISLPPWQWASFKNSCTDIQEAITKLESRLRSQTVTKQREVVMEKPVAGSVSGKNQVNADISNLTSSIPPYILNKQNDGDASRTLIPSSSQGKPFVREDDKTSGSSQSIAISDSREQINSERIQVEADISTSAPAFPTQGQVHHTVNRAHPEGLVSLQTARLDGRNYHSWRLHMEFFLKQLDLAYVLTEPFPGISLNPESSLEEKAKVQFAAQKWVDDDYLCRHNILNSLSDSLFQWYSQKISSARDLWEELKMTYDEDFGTKRSQIYKYIHFQMVDGVSILEQVQELHNIANSIMAFGTGIDEFFHVSVIISKLPPSWKEFRVKLMHEDFLPLNMLMHRLQVEEEFRNSHKKETYSKRGHIVEPKLDHRTGMRKREQTKRACYSCGREGHIIKNCPGRKFEVSDKSEKELGILPQTATRVDAATD